MKYIFLLLLLFLAMLFDIKSCKVPNALILTGYAAGTINLCMYHGAVGVLISLASIAIVWLVFSPVYIMKGLGGGDCKLLAWIPLFIGSKELLKCYFLVFICAGAVGILKLLVRKERSFRFTIAAFIGVLISMTMQYF